MSRFHYLTGIGIEDDKTGHIYNDKRDITIILNQIQEKSDNYADIVYTIKEYLLLKPLQLEEEDPNKDLQAYKDIEDKIIELLRTKRCT